MLRIREEQRWQVRRTTLSAMTDRDALPLPELYAELVDETVLAAWLAMAREEDLGSSGDITTASIIDPEACSTGLIAIRDEGVVAGLAILPVLLEVFESLAVLHLEVSDGQWCPPGTILARIEGRTADLLGMERTMLNILGRLSGIATSTSQALQAVEGTSVRIYGTRKTTPAMRHLEHYAIRCGGGCLHRQSLHDAVLYKDNHLDGIPGESLADHLSAAIATLRDAPGIRFVEVEVDTLEQLEKVLGMEEGLVDIILLDNMPPDVLVEAVCRRDAAGVPILLEASGGIGPGDLPAVAASGVDRIALGYLTHSASCLDMGLDIANTDT